MTLFEGISIWPTIVMRVVGFGLSSWMIWYTLHSLKTNRAQTQGEMGFADSATKAGPHLRKLGPKRWSIAWAATALIWLLWLPPRKPAAGKREAIAFGEVGGGPSGNRPERCIRAAIATAMMMLIWWLILSPIFGDLNSPARGDLARIIYLGVTLLDVVATLFLIFLVADATLYARAFIKRLTEVSTVWPPETVAEFTGRFRMRADDLADWLDMQFLVKRTGAITGLIYLPFLLLALLVASRGRLFDDFSTPWTLVIAQAISLAVVIASVLALRTAAENARSVARDNLRARIIAVQGKPKRARQLQLLLTEIDNLRNGALAPIASQPIVKAVLLPLITYGGTWLLHL